MAQSTFSGELRLGIMNSERVRALQKTLNAKMKAGLVPDADFGPLVFQAVQDYQRTVGLPVTGVVNKVTWDRLMGPVTISPANQTQMAQEVPMWVWLVVAGGAIWYWKYGR